MSFTIATYNVLATAYMKPEFYRSSADEHLDPKKRLAALTEHLLHLGADILCLQEVEDAVYEAVERRLSAAGYTGRLAKKGHGKPDGCAMFVASRRFEVTRDERFEYADGEAGLPRSGHIAQVVCLKHGERRLAIANTHLKWSPPSLPLDRQYGYRQIKELLDRRPGLAAEGAAWVVCGDLNVTSESGVVASLLEAGFEFTHARFGVAATCNPNGQAKMIDFIFHDRALEAEPMPLAVVRDDTPLPGPGQPSDHIAVLAKLAWRDPAA